MAENGMQALQIVSDKPPNYFDLIVLDINMPIMGGLEACARIYNYLSQESSFFGILPKNPSCGVPKNNKDLNLNLPDSRSQLNDFALKGSRKAATSQGFRSSRVEPKA